MPVSPEWIFSFKFSLDRFDEGTYEVPSLSISLAPITSTCGIPRTWILAISEALCTMAEEKADWFAITWCEKCVYHTLLLIHQGLASFVWKHKLTHKHMLQNAVLIILYSHKKDHISAHSCIAPDLFIMHDELVPCNSILCKRRGKLRLNRGDEIKQFTRRLLAVPVSRNFLDFNENLPVTSQNTLLYIQASILSKIWGQKVAT